MAFFPKRSVPETEYLLERAAKEASLADQAAGTPGAEIHQKLASSYLERLFGDQPSDGSPLPRRGLAPEKRKALLAVFSRYSQILAEQLPPQTGTDLAELLGQLDESTAETEERKSAA
jgi:hypothetical protein